MGFWDFLPSVLPAAITAGATLYGSSQASKANNKAANVATSATREATAAEIAALEVAQRNYAANQAAASPGLVHTRNIIASGEQLTPAQIASLGDARRTTLDALQGGSVRGSARATADAVRDVEGRMRGQFIDQNRARMDSAAGQLTGQYFGAGNNMATNAAQQGKSASTGLMTEGNIAASNAMGQGRIQGQAIGDVGAIVANEIKAGMNNKRDSSYETIYWNDGTTSRY